MSKNKIVSNAASIMSYMFCALKKDGKCDIEVGGTVSQCATLLSVAYENTNKPFFGAVILYAAAFVLENLGHGEMAMQIAEIAEKNFDPNKK